MKRLFLIMLLGVVVMLNSCNKATDMYNEAAVEQRDINRNADKYFAGKIDSNQDWNPITVGSVTIKADADLPDIVKVQVLTESPFFNSDAKVLNEAEVQKGQSVTLVFDAPDIYKKLVAACVSSKGVYYIQVFDVNASNVSFASQANSRMTRATASEVPSISTIKLKAPQKSFNAMRTELGDKCVINNVTYDLWKNSAWKDELMWEPANDNVFGGGWSVDPDKGCIFRTISGFSDSELENIKEIVDKFLVKEGNDQYSVNKKRNNIRLIRNSSYFTQNKNYLYTDGNNPITLIPIQANSTEFKWNHVYYYYFKPEAVAGMTSEEEADFIKKLPKYKAIQIERVQASADIGKFFRNKEFLLPFYGDNTPVQGENTASAIFPKGYKIGFLNMKHENGKYTSSNCKYGCTYGDGRLNYEVNHIAGHYLTAMDTSIGGSTKEGMMFTDPRIAVFTANNKTYMCFEDGADCTFCDMILEVGGGTDKIDETPEVEAAAYTMCFEDRPEVADYDMNDVVLQAVRINATHIQISVVACGAEDRVVLHGLNGCSRFDGKEIHEIFCLDEGQYFVNTEPDGLHLNPMSDIVTVDKNQSIKDYLKNVYIVNETTGRTIRMPEIGKPPYALIVPMNFQYPLEGKSIIAAYKHFLEWAADVNASGDWYKYGYADEIFPTLFKPW